MDRLGDVALRIPRPRGKNGEAIARAVRKWAGVVDVALTEAWIGVSFAEGVAPNVTDAQLRSLETLDEDEAPPRTIEIAVRYDGVDLADVARECNVDVALVHSRAEYTVLFLGFQPGFAYLGGLPRELVVPRLATPRARVPKNAVAIAGPYAGVYPFESPGGWRILGTADVTLFDTERGALLRPGDRVRFREIR